MVFHDSIWIVGNFPRHDSLPDVTGVRDSSTFPMSSDLSVLLSLAIVVAILFEVSFRAVKRYVTVMAPSLVTSSAKEGAAATLSQFGASYANSFIHAAILTVRGVYHVTQVIAGPPTCQLQGHSSECSALADACMSTGAIFLGYLIYDSMHLVACYPNLGGLDTLAHHLAFILSTIICNTYLRMLLPFSWLLIGELSTLPLNVRWFLITSGRGATRAMTAVNVSFALSFFCTRILLYGAGLAHLWLSRSTLLSMTRPPPAGVLNVVLALLTVGFALNAFWFKRIVSMATGGGQRGRSKNR